METTTLYVTKRFTRGLLSGLTWTGGITFVSVERADSWLKAVRAKGERGRLPYVIVDASFQKYAR